MIPVYNKALKGWQICYKNKPISNNVYASWEEAVYVMDKWGE